MGVETNNANRKKANKINGKELLKDTKEVQLNNYSVDTNMKWCVPETYT